MELTILLGIVGPSEAIVILFIAVLLFGGKKIPELMKGLGQGLKEFRNAVKDDRPSENTLNQ